MNYLKNYLNISEMKMFFIRLIKKIDILKNYSMKKEKMKK